MGTSDKGALSVNHTGGGGAPFEMGGRAQKVSDPRFSHFVAPLPVINGRSLTQTGILTGRHFR